MQKLKYLIILALGILLTLVYVQLDDYDSISNSLLDDNIKANETIKELQGTIEKLKKQNEKLQEDIVFLYYKVDNLNLEIESIEHEAIRREILAEQGAINEENEIGIEENPIEKNMQESTDIDNENTPTDSPEITLENENTITGFGTTNE